MKKMKKFLAFALICGFGLTAVACGNGGSEGGDQTTEMKKVGVIQLAEHLALDRAREGFIEGLSQEGFKEGENLEVIVNNAQGDQSNLATISQKFANDKPDLVCAIATPAAVSMASASPDIPVVGTAITDYVAAKLVKSNEAPGGNVTGTSDMNPIEEQVDLMTKVLPEMKTLGLMRSSAEENSRIQADIIKKVCKEKGIEVVEMTFSSVNDIQQVAQDLVNKKVEAIYAPTDNIISSAMPNLIRVTNDAKIPVFCGEEAQVEKGALITIGINYKALGVQTGKMAAKILKGEAKPAEMPIETAEKYQVTINDSASKLLGITIPDELKKDATIV